MFTGKLFPIADSFNNFSPEDLWAFALHFMKYNSFDTIIAFVVGSVSLIIFC